jgi:hypothetical protein
MQSATANLPIVSTWIVLDDERTASAFPQAGHLRSSDTRVHQLYWRCVVVFFATAVKSNGADCHYRLYTNVSADLAAAGSLIQCILRAMNVEVVQLPFTYNPPDGYCDKFRNQFYIFDILEHIAGEGANRFDLVLDSDCLCLRPLKDVFIAAYDYGALTLTDGYDDQGQTINGLTRKEMQDLFRDLGCALSIPPEYLCGELYCATSSVTELLASHARVIFNESINRWRQGELRFYEEAQLLTYLYYRLGIAAGTANVFARRIWTGVHFRNGVEEDRARHILHLPGEKRFGFKKLFHAVLQTSSWFHNIPYGDQWIGRMQEVVSIPQPSKLKLMIEASYYVFSRVERLFERSG